MNTFAELLLFILDIAWVIVLAHVIMSWLIAFSVLNARQQIVGQIWIALDNLLDPVYSRIRSILPRTGAVDLSPVVLLVGIYFLRILIRNNLMF
ncbi:MAG: YggT family protein [Albidovulum sp.]|nr:YggT family protein [Albidovulum sp.]